MCSSGVRSIVLVWARRSCGSSGGVKVRLVWPRISQVSRKSKALYRGKVLRRVEELIMLRVRGDTTLDNAMDPAGMDQGCCGEGASILLVLGMFRNIH